MYTHTEEAETLGSLQLPKPNMETMGDLHPPDQYLDTSCCSPGHLKQLFSGTQAEPFTETLVPNQAPKKYFFVEVADYSQFSCLQSHHVKEHLIPTIVF